VWEAFVTAMLAMGPAQERKSRYGDKPALVAGRRAIDHLEAPDVPCSGYPGPWTPSARQLLDRDRPR
jgi:hypothetical protein